MIKNLELFNSLLFIHCPWHERNRSENKFQQQLHKLPKEVLENQPLLELKFLKPLTQRKKYYHAVINNEAVSYLNTFHKAMKAAVTKDEKKYQIQKALVKQLRKKMKETSSIINDNEFYLENIFPVSRKSQTVAELKDDIYIIQLIKYKLIWLYLEIQNSYPAQLPQDAVEENDLLEMYFTELPPATSFFVTAPELNLPKLVQPVIKKETAKPFIIQKKDFRDPAKGVPTYEQLIANPDKFAKVEKELFDQGLINDQYNFQKKHNQISEFAALYQVLLKKKYFIPYYFPGKKKVTDLLVRRFLNHRYNANIDKEFRNFKNQKHLEQYIDTKPWLSLILPC